MVTLYEVRETSADLELGKLMYSNRSRDIVETQAMRLWHSTNRDLMLYDVMTKLVVMLFLCELTDAIINSRKL